MAMQKEKRAETHQEAIQCRQFWRTAPGAIDDQKLLFRQQAIGNNGSCAARSQKFGGRGQQMRKE